MAQADATQTLRISQARSADEREAVWRFRYGVYVEEMGKIALANADHKRRFLADELDEDALILYAQEGDAVVATLRINNAKRTRLPPALETAYRLSRFSAIAPERLSFSSRLMVARDLRGSVALHKILSRAYELGLESGVVYDFCYCAPALIELYEHLGYRPYTENFLDPEVGYRVPLILALKDAAHLEAVQSPFWRKLKNRPDLWQKQSDADWLAREFPATTKAARWGAGEDAFWQFLADKLRPSTGSRVPLLEGLSDDERKRVLKSGTVLSCQAGDTILRIGDVGNELFVVLSGLAEVRLPKAKQPIAVLEPGQVFGEIAFIANVKRSADVVALAESEILVVSQTFLRKLMRSAPDLASKVLFNLSRVLCERLVYSTRSMLPEKPKPPEKPAKKTPARRSSKV
ncbi:MAG: cyclic nucleotide-binding domain-containing protein [Alphaproteobacteria bacterium]|nr:cyclic nucleotide-binding domain-containing protein [Alphaproteobacteria bacterium]